MGKHSIPLLKIDFSTGIGSIIPSTQEAFRGNVFSGTVRKEERNSLKIFKRNLKDKLNKEIASLRQFPTKNEIYIFITQYFISQKEYYDRDIDNLSKTILDVLKGIFYESDSQVKVLLVCKKIEARVKHNFAYIAVKELKDNKDIEVLKMAGLERSITYYQELVRSGLI